jgi:nitroreductase
LDRLAAISTWFLGEKKTVDHLDLVKKRYAVRGYKPDLPEERLVQQVLEAGRLAPSAYNRQPYRFVVLRTKGREAELRQIYDRDWFVQAPVIICICGIPAEAGTRADGKSYLDIDVAIAMDYMVLAATELGLGTCWVGGFDAAGAREVLGLPDGVEPIIFSPLGYPAADRLTKERRTLQELIHYDRW